MAKRLSDATNEEMNAAFDAVHEKLEQAINEFCPRIFRRQAWEMLGSPDGRKALLETIDIGLDAVEELRKTKEAKLAPQGKGPL